MHYHNEKVDHWLEQAMLETENEKRQQIYQQVLDTLTTDAVILPIYHYYLPVKIAADIAGYDLNNPTQIFTAKISIVPCNKNAITLIAFSIDNKVISPAV